MSSDTRKPAPAKHPATELDHTIATLQLRLEQVNDLLPSLQRRASAFQVDDMNGLVRYFKTILETETPRPSYDELKDRFGACIALAALEITDGNITQAAKMLKLSRFGLQKIIQRMKKGSEPTPNDVSET